MGMIDALEADYTGLAKISGSFKCALRFSDKPLPGLGASTSQFWPLPKICQGQSNTHAFKRVSKRFLIAPMPCGWASQVKNEWGFAQAVWNPFRRWSLGP
jgi:hypothetical protein